MARFFLLLLFFLLGARTIWVASETESGWSTLRSQWWDATLGILAGRNANISQQEPADQAAFWLSQAERITGAEPQCAERAMGAALVLDAPATGFMFRYLTMPDIATSPDVPPSFRASIGPQWDEKRLSSAVAQFETMCAGPCLEMAARATELEPEYDQWWRLRALLPISEPACGDRRPRTRDWLTTVNQCGSHEPDNAIYDYVIASRLWDDSLACDYSDGETHLEVKDRAMFEEGLWYFERGQKKKACRIGDEWCRSVVAFLSRSCVGPAERAAIAESRLVYRRVDWIMMQLVRTQQRLAEQLDRTGDPSGALALLRQGLRCLDQFNDSRTSLEYGASSTLRSSTLAMLQILTEKHSKLVSSRESALIKSDAEAAMLRNKVLVEAGVRLTKKQADEPASLLKLVLFGIAVLAAPILLAMGAVCWCVGRQLTRGHERPADLIGPYRHAAVWITAYGLSFAVLGMAPAEVTPPVVQLWMASVLAALAAIAALIGFVWKLVPILRRRYGIRTWLGIVFVIVLALGLLPMLIAVSWNSLYAPARGWEGGDVNVLQHMMNSQPTASGGKWRWAVMQWSVAQPGAYVSIVIAVGLLACWHRLRWARTMGKADPRFCSHANLCGLLACVGRSMLVVGFGWLLTYLVLLPNAMQSGEDAYQKKMVYYRNPEEYWKTMIAAVGEVEVDADLMNRLRSGGRSN